MANKTADVKRKITEIKRLILEKQELLAVQKELYANAKQETLTKLLSGGKNFGEKTAYAYNDFLYEYNLCQHR